MFGERDGIADVVAVGVGEEDVGGVSFVGADIGQGIAGIEGVELEAVLAGVCGAPEDAGCDEAPDWDADDGVRRCGVGDAPST